LRKTLNAPSRGVLRDEEIVLVKRWNPQTGRDEALDDIVTAADNAAAAEQILNQVRAHVENRDVRVVASIAGGRKTMGALLHASMTLIGRETDRITHVLVQPPFDVLPGFFFPDQPGGPLPERDRNGETLRLHDPRSVEVFLTDVPFVPLRNRFRELDDMPGSFDGLVRQCSKALKQDSAPVKVQIDYPLKTLTVDGTPLRRVPVAILLLVDFLLEHPKDFQSQGDAGRTLLLWIRKGHPRNLDRVNFPVVAQQHAKAIRAGSPLPPWEGKSGDDERSEAERFISRTLSDLRGLLKKNYPRWIIPNVKGSCSLGRVERC
jgi:CRISPR-associated protein (TIGR02584 family)